MSFSTAQVVARAGVDPWSLAEQLPEAPGPAAERAVQWRNCAELAGEVVGLAERADRLTAQSYLNNGVEVFDAAAASAATRTALGDAGSDYADVSRALSRVQVQLETSIPGVQRAVADLDGEVRGVVEESLRLRDTLFESASAAAAAELALFDRAVEIVGRYGRTVSALVDDYEATLRRALGVLADQGFDAVPADPRAVAVPPPAGGSADEVATWWGGLSPERQAELLRTDPAALGNLDGLPGDVRDAANRLRLPLERARLEEEGNRPGALAALDAIEATLARGDRQLLSLDTSGTYVTAAVGIGDVDSADHVAVFTPGLATTVQDSLAGYDRSLDGLRRASGDLALQNGPGEVAVVAWLGYETPQLGGWNLANPVTTVASPHQAQVGADRLAGFLQGINASRAEDPHLTALGHSYGSLTTGLALQRETGVDDVVLFGSPGIGTSDVAADLRVPADHVYVAEAHDDYVGDAAWFGADPNQLSGVTELSTAEAAVPGTTQPLAASAGHETGGPAGYFGPDTTSVHNMAAVIAGAPDRLVPGEQRDWRDDLNAPFVPGG